MPNSNCRPILILAAVLLAAVPSIAAAEFGEEVTLTVQGSSGPCPAKIEGYWPNSGDAIDVWTVEENGIDPLYHEAIVMSAPKMSEVVNKKPCEFQVTVRVLAAKGGKIKQAVAAKKRITIMQAVKD